MHSSRSQRSPFHGVLHIVYDRVAEMHHFKEFCRISDWFLTQKYTLGGCKLKVRSAGNGMGGGGVGTQIQFSIYNQFWILNTRNQPILDTNPYFLAHCWCFVCVSGAQKHCFSICEQIICDIISIYNTTDFIYIENIVVNCKSGFAVRETAKR